MTFRFILGRTQRLFRKAQKLIDEWRFSEAVSTLDQAIALDPSYPQLLAFRALAFSEIGRYEDSIADIKKAEKLDPNNAALVMYEGRIHLDSGKLNQAAEAFARAQQLQPTNSFITAYEALAHYWSGRNDALGPITADFAFLPTQVKSRLLVALATRPKSQVNGGPHPSKLRWEEPGSGESHATLRKAVTRRLRKRVKRLYEAQRHEDVVVILVAAMGSGSLVDEELELLLKRAREQAIVVLERQLRSILAPDQDEARKGRLRWIFGRKTQRDQVEAQRLTLLLRLADVREPSDPSRYRDLQKWLSSYRRVSSPSARQRSVASDVLAEMARLALSDGRPQEAVDLCEQVRECRSHSEANWIEAEARLELGTITRARQLFERFAQTNLLVFEERVDQCLGVNQP